MKYDYSVYKNGKAYISIDGSEADVIRLVEYLKHWEVATDHWGKSKMSAGDGIQYDYFILVINAGSNSNPSAEKVTELMEQFRDEGNHNTELKTTGLPISESTLEELYYDTSGYYAYVLLNCEESALDHAVEALDRRDISTSRKGESYRAASNGIKYQWYLRLYKKGSTQDDKPEKGDVYSALKIVESDASVAGRLAKFLDSHSKEPTEELFRWAVEQESQVEKLTIELGASKEKIEELKREIKKLHGAHIEERNELRTKLREVTIQEQKYRQYHSKLQSTAEKRNIEIARLEQEIRALRDQRLGKTSEPSREQKSLLESRDKKIKSLEASLLEQEQQHRKFEEDLFKDLDESIKKSDEERSKIERMLVDLENSNAILSEENAQLASARNHANTYRSGGMGVDEESMNAMLSLMLPNLKFVDRGSLSFMLHEVHDLSKPIEILTKIHYSPQNINRRTKVEGKLGWYETKFNTGTGREAGRVYFKHQGGGCEVVVSEKSLQGEDIKKLP
jgi:hypothetical protein